MVDTDSGVFADNQPTKTSPTVADVFRTFGPAYRQAHPRLPLSHLQVMRAIETCRTPQRGGHVYTCDHCGKHTFSYFSCRNRHCPTCQFLPAQRWLEKRQQDLLPIPYFHVVFTLPEQLRPLALSNPQCLYRLLFHAASQTLLQLAADPKHLGARIGFSAILHTWSQTLLYHPHLHCIVTGGGLAPDNTLWIAAKEEFFIHVRPLADLFRGKFLDELRKTHQDGNLRFSEHTRHLDAPGAFGKLLSQLYHTPWNVYCKPPFGGPHHVLEYLSAYTHRIAISNHRILALDQQTVTFRYRDSADAKKTKTMTLQGFEFIRRFLLHVLPPGFVRIRHYGLLSNRNRKTHLDLARTSLGIPLPPQDQKTTPLPWQDLLLARTGIDPYLCPHCLKGRLSLSHCLLPKRPP